MAKEIGSQKFFTASEVAAEAGVHRLTLLRWIREGRLGDVPRDRNNWRLFSESQLQDIANFARARQPSSAPRAGANQRSLFKLSETQK